MKRVINVTQRDIDHGGKSMSNCPVALAARRALGDWVDDVTETSIYDRIDNREPRVGLPERVGSWIRLYDQRGRVKPIRFTVEVPE